MRGRGIFHAFDPCSQVAFGECCTCEPCALLCVREPGGLAAPQPTRGHSESPGLCGSSSSSCQVPGPTARCCFGGKLSHHPQATDSSVALAAALPESQGRGSRPSEGGGVHLQVSQGLQSSQGLTTLSPCAWDAAGVSNESPERSATLL